MNKRIKSPKAKKLKENHLVDLLQSNLDTLNRTLILNGPVDDVMLNKVVHAFHFFLHQSSEEPVTIKLTTEGGSEEYMFGIFDIISSAPFRVIMIGIGIVASAGAVIFQAADKRILLKHTSFMHHIGSVGKEDCHMEDFYAYAEYLKVINKKADMIMLARVQEAHPNFSMAQWRRRDSKDNWLSADQAVGMGLADEVLD